MINFKCTQPEYELIDKIADRAEPIYREMKLGDDRRDILMDLTACHCNGCRLNLAGLLTASDLDFGHDVLGIRRYIDRTTGQITGGFFPRYAEAQ